MRNYKSKTSQAPFKPVAEEIPEHILNNIFDVLDAIRESIAAEDFDLKAALLAQTWLNDNKPVIIKYKSAQEFYDVYTDLDNYIDKRR